MPVVKKTSRVFIVGGTAAPGSFGYGDPYNTSQGLKGYWRLNENIPVVPGVSIAKDSSGNNRHGTYNNSLVTPTSGTPSFIPWSPPFLSETSHAAKFTQYTAYEGDYVELGTAGALGITNSSYSISCWAKLSDNTASNPEVIISIIDDDYTPNRSWVYVNDNEIRVLVTNFTPWSSVAVRSAADTYNDGKFHHIVATCEYTPPAIFDPGVDEGSQVWKLYVDGILVDTSPPLSDLWSIKSTDVITVGLDLDAGGTPLTDFYNDAITELAIWDRVLTQENISDVYAGGISSKYRQLMSGFLNNPPRTIIRARDAATGSYPSIQRTNPGGRSGAHTINFNDTNTVIFRDSYDTAEIEFLPGRIRDEATITLNATDGSGQTQTGTFEFQRGTKLTSGNIEVNIGRKRAPEKVAAVFTKAVNDSSLCISAKYNKGKVTLRQQVPGSFSHPITIDLRHRPPRQTGALITVSNSDAPSTGPRRYINGSFSGGSDYVARYPNLLHGQYAGHNDAGNEGHGPDDPLARWTMQNIATPNLPSDLVAPAVTQRGVADVGITFTPGEDLGFFRDDRVNIDNDNEFYDEGSSPSEIEGFGSPLRSKTQIVIDMPVVAPTTIGYDKSILPGPTGDPGYLFHNMAYYNSDTRVWEKVGPGLNVGGTGHGTPREYHQAFFDDACIGFSRGIEMLESGSIMSCRPINNFGFPMHPKFEAKDGQTIALSDYITHPFVLEKFTLELDIAAVEGSEWRNRACMYSNNDTGIGRENDQGNYNNKAMIQSFFLMNQRPYHGELNWSTTVYDAGSSTWEDGETLYLPSVAKWVDSDDDSFLCDPEFNYEQSMYQAFYYFPAIEIPDGNGGFRSPVAGDTVGCYNLLNDGTRVYTSYFPNSSLGNAWDFGNMMNNPIPAMGYDSQFLPETNNFFSPGDIPHFTIYDSQLNTCWDTDVCRAPPDGSYSCDGPAFNSPDQSSQQCFYLFPDGIEIPDIQNPGQYRSPVLGDAIASYKQLTTTTRVYTSVYDTFNLGNDMIVTMGDDGGNGHDDWFTQGEIPRFAIYDSIAGKCWDTNVCIMTSDGSYTSSQQCGGNSCIGPTFGGVDNTTLQHFHFFNSIEVPTATGGTRALVDGQDTIGAYKIQNNGTRVYCGYLDNISGGAETIPVWADDGSSPAGYPTAGDIVQFTIYDGDLGVCWDTNVCLTTNPNDCEEDNAEGFVNNAFSTYSKLEGIFTTQSVESCDQDNAPGWCNNQIYICTKLQGIYTGASGLSCEPDNATPFSNNLNDSTSEKLMGTTESGGGVTAWFPTTITVNSSRELITYGQVTTYKGINDAHEDIQKILDEGLEREITVEGTKVDGDPHTGADGVSIATSGSFVMEGTCKVPIKHSEGSAYLIDAYDYAGATSVTSMGKIFFKTDHPGTRSGISDSIRSQRGLNSTVPGSAPIGTEKETGDAYGGGGGGSTNSSTLQLMEPGRENSPYILLPGDKLVIGCQSMQPYWARRTVDQDEYGISPYQGPHLTLAPGASATNTIPFKLTLYGSLIRDDKEYHEPLNQPLTSDALHEALHYDNPTVDQFDTDEIGNLAGTMRDELYGGDIFSFGPYKSTSTLVFNPYKNVSGFDARETRNSLYIEPHIKGASGTNTMTEEDWVGELSHPSLVLKFSTGYPTAHIGPGTPNDAGIFADWITNNESTIETHYTDYPDHPQGYSADIVDPEFVGATAILKLGRSDPTEADPAHLTYLKELNSSIAMTIHWSSGLSSSNKWELNSMTSGVFTGVELERPDIGEEIMVQQTTGNPSDSSTVWETVNVLQLLKPEGGHPFRVSSIAIPSPGSPYYIRLAQTAGDGPTYDHHAILGVKIKEAVLDSTSNREFYHGSVTGATGLFSNKPGASAWVLPLNPVHSAQRVIAGSPENSSIAYMDELRIRAEGGAGSPECGFSPGIDLTTGGEFDMSATNNPNNPGQIASSSNKVRGGNVNYRTGDFQIRYDAVMPGPRVRVTGGEDYSRMDEIGSIYPPGPTGEHTSASVGYYIGHSGAEGPGATSGAAGFSDGSWPRSYGGEPSESQYTGDFATFAIKFTGGKDATDSEFGLGLPQIMATTGETAAGGLDGDWNTTGAYCRPIKSIHDFNCTKETTRWSNGATETGRIRFGKDSGGWPILLIPNPSTAPENSFCSSGEPGDGALNSVFIIVLTDDYIEPDSMICKSPAASWDNDDWEGSENQFYSSTWAVPYAWTSPNPGPQDAMPFTGRYLASPDNGVQYIFVPIGACIDKDEWDNNKLVKYSSERQAQALYNAVISYNNTACRGIPEWDSDYIHFAGVRITSDGDPNGELGKLSSTSIWSSGIPYNEPITDIFPHYSIVDADNADASPPAPSDNWGVPTSGSVSGSGASNPRPSTVFCYDVKIIEDEFGIKNSVVFESWYGGAHANKPIVFLSSEWSIAFKTTIGACDIGSYSVPTSWDPNNPGQADVKLPLASELFEAEPWEYIQITAGGWSIAYDETSECEPGWPNNGLNFTSFEEVSAISGAIIGGRDPSKITNHASFDVISSPVQCASYVDIKVFPNIDPEANWGDNDVGATEEKPFDEEFTFRFYFNDHGTQYMSYVSDPDHPGGASSNPLGATGGIVYADTGGTVNEKYDGGIYVVDKRWDYDTVQWWLSPMFDDRVLEPGELTLAIERVMSDPSTRVRIDDQADEWTGEGIPAGWTTLSKIPAWRRLGFDAEGGKLKITDIAAHTVLAITGSDNTILDELVDVIVEQPGDQFVQGRIYHERTRQVQARFTQSGSLPWTGNPMPGPGERGSFYRNMKMSSETDRYYDSMTPSLPSYHQSRGKSLLGLYGYHMVVGQPSPADGGTIVPEVTKITCGPESVPLDHHSSLADGLETSIEGCWFTIYDAENLAYNVWYDIDGRGDIGYPPVAPSDPSGILIKVEDVNIGADSSEVASRTASAIAEYPQFIIDYESGDGFFTVTSSRDGSAPDASFPGVEGQEDTNSNIVIGGAPGCAGASENGDGPNTDGGDTVNNPQAEWKIEVTQQGIDAYPKELTPAIDDGWLSTFPFEGAHGRLQRELFTRDESTWSVVNAAELTEDIAPAGTYGSSAVEEKFTTLFVTGSIFGYGLEPGKDMPNPWPEAEYNAQYYGAQGFISDNDGNIYLEKSEEVRSNAYKFYFGAGRGWGHGPLLSQISTWRYVPHIRGWKYGLISGLPLNASSIFRSDRYGQFRDLMEQRKDTRYFKVGEENKKTQLSASPVLCRFLDPDGGTTEPELTWSQNINAYCTSSMPFIDDGVPRNRDPIDPSMLNLSTELIGE